MTKRIKIFAAGCFYCLLCSLSSAVIPAVGAVVERELGITHASFGMAIAFFMGGVVAGYLVFLSFSGPVWTVRIVRGSILVLASAGLISVVPSFIAVLCGRFLFGVAWSCAAMAASLIIVQYFERNQQNLFCIVHATFLAGLGAGMYLTPPAARLLGSWQAFALVLAGIGGVLLLAACVFPVELNMEKRPSLISSFFGCIMQKRVALLVALLSGYCAVETAMSYFCAVYAQMELRLPVWQAAKITAFFLLGIVAGRLIFVLWIRRQPALPVIAGLVLTGCVFLLAGLAARGYCLPAGAMFMAGILFGPVYPLGIAGAVAATATNKDVAVSAGNVVINLACLIGVFAVGWIGDLVSLRFGLVMFCLMLMVLAALIGFAVRRRV